ncbi:MAG: hypothetical protein ABF990_03275 [Acetobacter sp.]
MQADIVRQAQIFRFKDRRAGFILVVEPKGQPVLSGVQPGGT